MKLGELVDDWVASPPKTYFELKKAIEDEDSSFMDFARIIGSDPALVARLLRIVNSPLYGFSSQVETIQHALTIVGVQQLSELVLATTVMENFKGIPKRLLNMDTFWEHSIACGIAAKILANHLNESELDRFNVAGMLHDLGRLIISKKAPEQAEAIFSLSESRESLIDEVEKKVLGFTHAEVGASLLKAWKLPPRLVEVISCSHHPSRAKNYPLDAAIIHVADILAYQIKLGGSGERVVPQVDESVFQRTPLTQEMIVSAGSELEQLFENDKNVFSLAG